MRIAIASDHAGFSLRQELVAHLREVGHEVIDHGPEKAERCDYPDFATLVAKSVQTGEVDKGVLVCGSGIGMSMAVNRHSGIRAVVAALEIQAKLSRAHNDANIVCLGERITGVDLAKSIVNAFLTTSFEGGRHQGRVSKIEAI